MKSGFKRVSHNTNKSAYPGTKVNTKTRQIFVSSGSSTFDMLLSGGIPIGSIVVLEQDDPSSCYKCMISKYIIDGLVHDHSVHCALIDNNKTCAYRNYIDYHNRGTLLRSTSKNSLSKENGEGDKLAKELDSNLKISWRYSFLKTLRNEEEKKNEEERIATMHFYNTKVNYSDINIYDIISENIPKVILDFVCSSTVEKLSQSTMKEPKNIKRLVLEDITNPLWGFSSWDCNKMIAYLYTLKSSVRRSSVACVITVANVSDNSCVHAVEQAHFYHKLKQVADVYIKMSAVNHINSNENDVKNNYYKEVDGFIELIKMHPLSYIDNNPLDSKEWAFKIERNRFTIKPLSIPVDSENTDNADENKNKISCSYSNNSNKQNLDF